MRHDGKIGVLKQVSSSFGPGFKGSLSLKVANTRLKVPESQLLPHIGEGCETLIP